MKPLRGKAGPAALALVAWSCGIVPVARGEAPRVVAEEVREFDILVKDKPVGASMMRISDADDGTTRVATEVNVKLNYLVYVYRYEFHGQETWRGGRLVSADNRAMDDGKRFSARVSIDAGGAAIKANGRAQRVAAVEMTTNYWHVPDMAKGAKFSLMNADRGSVHAVTIQPVGVDKVVVDRQEIECTHYRIRGEIEADVWFDRQGRAVRQKSIEDGYPTELVMRHISTAPARTARR